jgi:CBS domain-containing protein
MVEYDCGEIPVVDGRDTMIPIGVITDRDITCRAVAEGCDPTETTVREYMSTPCVTVRPEASMAECCQVLEENQLRRVPVVDDSGRLCGIVAQADIAKNASPRQTGEVVREVSQGM